MELRSTSRIQLNNKKGVSKKEKKNLIADIICYKAFKFMFDITSNV